MKNLYLLTLLSLIGLSKIYSQDYFPLIKGSYWIYNVFEDGTLSYSDSVTYNETTTINDTAFHEFIHYYIENDVVSQTDTFFLYDNPNDYNTIMLSNRNQDIIDSAIYAKHNYTDEEWWIAHKFPQDDTIRVTLADKVTVAAGEFNNCIIQGEEYIFAPEIGIIKILLWNDASYHELIRYNIPVSLPATKSMPEQEFTIYPNPFNNCVHIKGITNAPYRIISSEGKLIDSGITNYDLIQTEKLNSGIYFLLIRKDNKEYVIEMSKE